MQTATMYSPRQPFFESSCGSFLSSPGLPGSAVYQYYSLCKSSDPRKNMIAVPDGTVDILFNCSVDAPGAWVCGSVKHGKIVQIEEGTLYFGVRFFPAAAERILNTHLDQFTDREVPLLEVNRRAGFLLDLVSSADSFASRIHLFEEFCEMSAGDTNPLPMIVGYMLKEMHAVHGEVRIQDLEHKTGYSARHLNNIFKKHVGTTPKFYTRVMRFQHIFDVMTRSGCLADYSDLAEEAGYYDQAHFINEFKDFALSTPKKIFCQYNA